MDPRSPTSRLLVGLAVTLLAVSLFSWYALQQIDGLRRLQTQTIDRNRKDSLQLLRIQNNLHNLGLSMRDIIEGAAPYPVSAWKAEFDRTRIDLADALRIEKELGPTSRTPEQQVFLEDAIRDFWAAAEGMFRLSEEGQEAQARDAVRNVLQPRHASIATTTARFLVMNNEAEQQATEAIQAIYASVERNIYYFLVAVVLAICGTTAYLILQNRRIFASLEQLSHQRQVLARKIITVQEDLFRAIARELHDEFGQVLTAVGALLERARKKQEQSPEELARRLREMQEVVQGALEGVRGLSQRLHPNVLDDYGLEGAIEWYVKTIREQSGVTVTYEKDGGGVPYVPPEVAIHVYRIVQESLSNVIRHAKAEAAWVRLGRHDDTLRLEVEDHGVGLPDKSIRSDGLGLVAMQERAELVRGKLSVERLRRGGTRIRLEVPLGIS